MTLKTVKEKKILVALVMVLLLVSLSAGMIEASGPQNEVKSDTEIVMANWLGEGSPDWDSIGQEAIVDYGDSALIEVKDSVLEEGRNDIFFERTESRKKILTDFGNLDIKKMDNINSNHDGLYLIQMIGPVKGKWLDDLKTNDVNVLEYIPNNAYIVDATDTSMRIIEDKKFVRAIKPYGANMRVHPEVYNSEREYTDITVLVKPNSNVMDCLRAKSIQLDYIFSLGEKEAYHSKIDSDYIESLKEWSGLIWVENFVKPNVHGEKGTEQVTGKFDGYGGQVHNIGYSGEGVKVAVADTGLDSGENSTLHPDLKGRVSHFYHYGTTTSPEDAYGHGTHCAGIVAGNGQTGLKDNYGKLYGVGVAPKANLVGQKIFTSSGGYAYPNFDQMAYDAVKSGCVVSQNSWGGPATSQYDIMAAAYDTYVRDSNLFEEGEQKLTYVFSAGNTGRKGYSTIGSPGTAKNVITVGSNEVYRPEFGDGADNPEELAVYSSKGPVEDGRMKPDIVAPGSWVSSALSSESTPGWAYGSPDGKYYEYCSGTSMATPQVSGGAAVFTEYYEESYGEKPTPSLVKAALINGAVDLEGVQNGAESSVPNNAEGWGKMDLTNTVMGDDSVDYVNCQKNLETGETFSKSVEVTDNSKPLKITMAYSDVPASPKSKINLVNDLNLMVKGPEGKLYVGNCFTDGWSDPQKSGTDSINNVERVSIKNPIKGDYKIFVNGFKIQSDAVEATSLVDQDFSLVVKGGFEGPSPGIIKTDKNYYKPGEEIDITLRDANLNDDKYEVEKVQVRVSSSIPDGENLLLREKSKDSSVFKGTIRTAMNKPEFDDGFLQVAEKDTVQVIYIDNNPYGEKKCTAVVDGVKPELKSVTINKTYPESAVIEMDTDEPTNYILKYKKANSDKNWDEISTEIHSMNHQIQLKGLAYQTEYNFYLQLEDQTGNYLIDKNGGNYYSFTTNRPAPILLVDDEGEYKNYESYFEEALTANGYNYDVWKTTSDGTPSAEKLRFYEAVIWTTGYTYNLPINTEEEQVLADYLEHNGKLFLSSEDYTDEVGQVNDFMKNYLQISNITVEWGGTSNITAVENDTITDGLGTLDLTYPYYHKKADNINPTKNGSTIFEDAENGSVAVRTNNESLPWRSVFFSVPFEAIHENSTSNGNQVMSRVMSWLIQDQEQDLSVKRMDVSNDWIRPDQKTEAVAWISNDGTQDAANVDLEITADGKVLNSTTIKTLKSGELRKVNLGFSIENIGKHSVNLKIQPLQYENETKDNCMDNVIYVKSPNGTIKVAVLDSYGTDMAVYQPSNLIWDYLETHWWKYSNYKLDIDYTSLNKEGISYNDIEGTNADVLFIANAWHEDSNWEFTEKEIKAIKSYVMTGHGIISSGGTFGQYATGNMKLAPVFGMNENYYGGWGGIYETEEPITVMDKDHPIFNGIDSQYELAGDKSLLCLSNKVENGYKKARGVVTVYRNDYYGFVSENKYYGGEAISFPHHLTKQVDGNGVEKRLTYNSIEWAYKNSTEVSHELIGDLSYKSKYCELGNKSEFLYTVHNGGKTTEENLKVHISANGNLLSTKTIDELKPGKNEDIYFSWTPSKVDNYDMKIWVSSVDQEISVENNNYTFKFRTLIRGKKIEVYATQGYLQVKGYSEEILDYFASNWYKYGDNPIDFDLTTLNHEYNEFEIDYENLFETRADVLLFSNTDPDKFKKRDLTDQEIYAVENFTKQGCGIVATAGTFNGQGSMINSMKLAPLFGLNESRPGRWEKQLMTDPNKGEPQGYDLKDPTHNIFDGVDDPYVPGPHKRLNTYNDMIVTEDWTYVCSDIKAYDSSILGKYTMIDNPGIENDSNIYITGNKTGAGQGIYMSHEPFYVYGVPWEKDLQFYYNSLEYAYENSTMKPRLNHKSKNYMSSSGNIEIDLEVYDRNDEINSVKMYYKSGSESSYRSVDMSLESGTVRDGVWRTSLQFDGEDMNYYFEAVDEAGHISTSPFEASGNNYTISIDSEKPQIDHTPIDQITMGKAKELRATVTDNSNLGNVEIIFNDVNSVENTVNMTCIEGDNYIGYLPEQYENGSFKYSIRAEDVNGNINETDKYSVNIEGGIIKLITVDRDGDKVPFVGGLMENVETGEVSDIETDRRGEFYWSLSDFEQGYSVGDQINIECYYNGDSSVSTKDIQSSDGLTIIEVKFEQEIFDTELPTIIDNSDDTCQTGKNFGFSANVSDNKDVSDVYVKYRFGTSDYQNVSMDKVYDKYKQTIDIPESKELLEYKILAVDSSDNWNSTKIKQLPITDVISPTAQAGEDITVDMSEQFTLNASSSSDNIGIVGYTWIVDGEEITGESINHTFDEAGEYTVNLIIEDEAGNTAEDSLTVTILDIEDPVIDIVDTVESEVGDTVTFDASGSTDNVGIETYTWTIGDTVKNGVTITHSWSEPGTYEVNVEVTDQAGNKAADNVTVVVVDNESPIADAGEDRTIDMNTEVILDGSESSDNIGIDSFTWTFNNGTQNELSGESVEYKFKRAGRFEVRLRVEDTSGNVDEDTVVITVEDTEAPSAAAGEDTTIDVGTEFTFDASDSSDNVEIVNYAWTINGISLNGMQTSYTFVEPAEYDVVLTVTDKAGNTAEDSFVLNIIDETNPTADAGSDVTVEVGTEVKFDGTGSSDDVEISSYTWNIDGQEKNGVTCSNTFDEVGSYEAQLSIEDTSGNVDTDTVTIEVVDTQDPDAKAADVNVVKAGKTLQLDAGGSSDNTGIDEYVWIIDGEEFTGKQIEHKFDKSGTHEVTLKVTDSSGNVDTDTFSIDVKEKQSAVEEYWWIIPILILSGGMILMLSKSDLMQNNTGKQSEEVNQIETEENDIPEEKEELFENIEE